MKKVFVIGVVGGSGAGKTTLAEALVEAIGVDRACLIQQDNYYHDQSHLPLKDRRTVNFDHPEALDQSLCIEHIRCLIQKKEISVPIYDFTSHTRKAGSKTHSPRDMVVLEGRLLFFYKDLRDLIDLKVFIDTDIDVSFIRRLQRDTVERGRRMDSVIDQYLSTVKPMHEQFVQPTINYADLVVCGNDNLHDALEATLRHVDLG